MALPFHQLVGTLASAVVQAQQQVRQAHLGALYSYFKEGSPVSVDLQVPRVNPTTGAQEPATIRVPLIALVNPSQLAIQQIQITMQVDVSEIAPSLPLTPPPAPGPTPTPGPTPPVGLADTVARSITAPLHGWTPLTYTPALAASTTTGKQAGQPGIAQVTVTIAAEETSEGLSRLVNHLNKSL